MKCWYALSLMPLLASLPVRSALAADRACSLLEVETDAVVRARWPEETERLHEALDARDDLDACARVRLSMRDGSIAVEVVLPDGRFAARSVSRTEDLLPTLEALLLVPARELAPQVPETAPPSAATTLVVITNTTAPIADRPAPAQARPDASEPDRLGIEFSLATGARVGDGQMGVGLGLLSFLDLASWLVGVSARADQYRNITPGPQPPAAALELALLAGRRFRFDSLALDVSAGPAVALSGDTEEAQSAPAGDVGVIRPPPTSRTDHAPRVLLGARLIFNARSVFRQFVSIEGDFATARPREVQLPAWTLGLTLGATVGTL